MNDDATPDERAPNLSQPDDHLHVVGIGASAGGIRALQQFFGAVNPDTETAFVVVMHLSPEHESHLNQVLEQTSPIAVTQVTERTQMQPGHIFVIPPNKNLEITDGHLIVTDFDEPRGLRAPIDVFFRTLAQVHPDGVGIVMSGSGTDGTVGMKAIKEHGGVLMVQSPDEAEYDSMPNSAIDTGLIDFVLPADQLAEKVEELAKGRHRKLLSVDASQLDEKDEKTLQKILVRIQAHTGHDFVGYKRSTLCRRISRRMGVAQLDTLEAYLEYLQRNQSETLVLQKDFLISVTDFFRDPDAFAALAQKALPRIVERAGETEQVRIWVPGCATGEEVYSLAILLREEADRHASPPSFQIFATDLDDEALAFAREGRYPDAIAADVSQERLRRFFDREGENHRVKSELREMILFASHDLLKDPPFSNLALISCRNLLIYLQRDLQTRVYELFHYALDSEGFLFVGSSESAETVTPLFRTIDKRNRLYQRKPHSSHISHRLPELPLKLSGRPQFHKRPRTSRIEDAEHGSDGAIHERALEAHAPPSILVDRNHDIVHLSEHGGRYLQVPGGSPTSNVIKLAKRPLRVELRAGLQSVFEDQKPTLSAPIRLEESAEPTVRLHFSAAPGDADETLALVLFIDVASTLTASAVEEALDPEADQHARRLAREVDRLRDQLQISSERSETQQEELKATNEELQSINEEYKSTLEELETSKEELQSVNEELKTVNIELKEKVDQLSNANNNLKNLMGATDVATLFVDRELQIKLYTPALEAIFNVRPLDEGRPLSHVTHHLDVDDLEARASEVLRSLIPFEQTVESNDEKWYLMRILPYRTLEDHIEGVFFTFIDVTRIREARASLRRTREHDDLLERLEERTRQVRKLASVLTKAEQRERRRLSQILHDSLQQRLYGIQEKMTHVRDCAESGEREELSDHANQAWELIEKAIETTRQLSVELSPPVLEGDDLTDAIAWLKAQMSETHGLEVDVDAEQSIPIPNQDMLVLLFHLVRELLVNVVKHAQTDHASVEVRDEAGDLVIEVTDHGVGFELEELPEERGQGGLGLVSIRERLDLFGGRLHIASAPGEGTAVSLRVPMDAGEVLFSPPTEAEAEQDPQLVE